MARCSCCSAPVDPSSDPTGHLLECTQVDQGRLAECAAGELCCCSEPTHFQHYAHPWFASTAAATTTTTVSPSPPTTAAVAVSAAESGLKRPLDSNDSVEAKRVRSDANTPRSPMKQSVLDVFLGISSTMRTLAAEATVQVRSSSSSFWGTTKTKTSSTPASAAAVSATASTTSLVPARRGARNLRPCPFYKRVGPFAVDAFTYGAIPDCAGYFLSHYHSDHYGGLSRLWREPIYCSQVTFALAKQHGAVSHMYLRALPMDTLVNIPNTTAKVALIDANHCPGAVLFLFILADGTVHLHTGDCRYDKRFIEHPILKLYLQRLHTLYLDTTYLDPRYDFPTQQDTLDAVAEFATTSLARFKKALFVVGTYSIGKERVVKAVARAIGSPIYATARKRKTLKLLDDRYFSETTLATRPVDARVHIVSMSELTPNKLHLYLSALEAPVKSRSAGGEGSPFDCVIGFHPSGWNETRKKKDTTTGAGLLSVTHVGRSTIVKVPYSEHSSYGELREFVSAVRVRRILPTVNVGLAEDRQRMSGLLAPWHAKW